MRIVMIDTEIRQNILEDYHKPEMSEIVHQTSHVIQGEKIESKKRSMIL